MAEPEDLIIDGAYVATRLARTIWQRHLAPVSAGITLARVRLRLELFVQALFGQSIAIAAAPLPTPVSWLARLAGRAPAPDPDVEAGSDGVRVYLPSMLAVPAGKEIETYLLLAVQQAARVVRGSAVAEAAIGDDQTRDWFGLADGIAIDHWMAEMTPGLLHNLQDARAEALSRRARFSPTVAQRPVEGLLRAQLSRHPLTPPDDLPFDGGAQDAVGWARRQRGGQTPGAYRRIPPVWYWGRPVSISEGASQPEGGRPEETPRNMSHPRVVEMARRPRVREAAEDEDDAGSGTWIIRADEPQETVEDPLGLQRPTDRADQADPEGLGDALSDLPEARVVNTPGQAREILLPPDVLPRSARLPVAPTHAGVTYPEWDFQCGAYRIPGAVVREADPLLGDPRWVAEVLARHGRFVRRVRARFERVRPRRRWIDRQPDGPELDIAAWVAAIADGHAGGIVDDRLYVAMRPARRNLAVSLLVDVSASTDSWVSGQQRIVDVEREALLVLCEALDALGDRYAISAFSGEGSQDVSIVWLKRFAERTDATVRRRIAALDADRYTRMGAAIRHASASLARERVQRRLLLILSDGKPNDVDAYEGQYGIEDARQAVAESRAQDIHLFCLTVDREAPRYASRIFGRHSFGVLRRAAQLPEVTIEVLRRLICT